LTGLLTGKLVDLQLDFINRGQLVLLVLVNISVLCQLSGVLDVVRLLGELPGVVGRVTNVDVVDCAPPSVSIYLSSTNREHLHKISSVIVQSSNPTPPRGSKSAGCISS
jgi:hypothetical protein